MNHDPLCPALYPNVNGWCLCHFIDGVRADERDKIIEFIEEAKAISHEMMLSGRSLTGDGFASVLERLIEESD